MQEQYKIDGHDGINKKFVDDYFFVVDKLKTNTFARKELIRIVSEIILTANKQNKTNTFI